MSEALVRHADAATDASACAEIYAPYVLETVISFEDDPPDVAEMRHRIEEVSARYPWLVAEEDGRVVGYAYADPHRDRAAYRWAVDVAIYIDPAFHGRGIGRALYETLFELLTEQGYRTAVAGIALPNPASIAIHEKLGFEPVGVYRSIGWKLGAWHDVAWYQRPLADGGDSVPNEPAPPPPRT
jgi:phosphinothricin acetyltransferase